MGEIVDAMEKFDQRKDALRCEPDGSISADTDTARLMLSGLDIDIDELHAGRIAAAEAARLAVNEKIEAGEDATATIASEFAGLWVDGFVTGLLTGLDREDP